METTTIAITKQIRDKLGEFGTKNESYSQILERLIKSANDRLLYDVLMSEEGCISIEEAIKEADKKWSK